MKTTLWTLLIVTAWAQFAATQVGAQGLLEGEFGDIDLGRTLIEPGRFPTIQELRKAVRQPEMKSVLMLKLFGDTQNHHVPVWSPDGKRLAFQRTSRGSDASQLLLFTSMSEPQPTLLTKTPDAYDQMFRWGINNPASFVFSRINSAKRCTDVMYSADGQTLEIRTGSDGHALYPSLFERTDGVRWLAFERDGQVMQQAWDATQKAEQPIARGTAPRWSRDGKMLLMAREKARSGKLAAHQIAVQTIGAKSAKELVLETPDSVVIRSPVWSPNERWVAYYCRDQGDNTPWRIMVCEHAENASHRLAIADVVLNGTFRSEGPTWEPSSRRVWSFSHQQRQQEYFPLVALDIESSRSITVDYSARCTTPNDLTINATSTVPEFAFVGHVSGPQDLFVLFLNHF